MLATLNRTAAARIKADGENCSHLMHEIGMTDEEGYDDQLQIAKSTAVVIPMPTDLQEPHFKERCLVSQLSIKVVADLRKVETELFDYLADKMGSSNVRKRLLASNNQARLLRLLFSAALYSLRLSEEGA